MLKVGRLPTMADFQRELEASRRTIARDLDFLRMEENAPITCDRGGDGYRLTDAMLPVPPAEMSSGELSSLAAAPVPRRSGERERTDHTGVGPQDLLT